jgi:hypothetical protein
MYKRRISPDPICPICCSEEETIVHALWGCISAQDVWADCSVKIQKSSQVSTDFLSIMDYLMERCEVKEVQLAVLVARQIWHRRNAVIFGGKFSSPKSIVQAAKAQLEFFCSIEMKSATSSSYPRGLEDVCWKAPSGGVLKANWDAAVDGRRKKIGIGVIVRDHEARVIAMLSETKDFIKDPATAEALAARRAVELSLNLGIQRLILEGDSLSIVQAIQEARSGHMYELIIKDINFMLRGIRDYKVAFVPREANGEAHKLSKLAFSIGENRIWREDFPRL